MPEAVKNLVVVDSWDGAYLVNEYYRPIAEALKAKFEELKHVPVKHILFVENTVDKRKRNGKTVYAQVGKIPGRWQEIIQQLTGRHFTFMIEVFRENIEGMSKAQVVAVIYHEMRHIQLVVDQNGVDLKIVGHDIDDWVNMIEKLGPNWASTMGSIPDLLADGVDWNTITGPAALFPEMTIRLVK